MRIRREIVAMLMLVWLCVGLSACYAGDDTMGSDIVGYNHTDHHLGSFSVDELWRMGLPLWETTRTNPGTPSSSSPVARS